MGTQPVTNSELDIAFSGPAIASNRFFVTVGPTVRIAFCEQLGPNIGPKFRTAVSLPAQDAIALAELLKQLLAPIEAQIKAASSAHDAEKVAPVTSNG
jgi:hypothetical protein